jgi:bacillithiol biosynthesis cysteine-adding enzyme BshC
VREEFAARDWLAALGGALSPSGASAERLNRVARGRGVVVTSGQQAGLFGGPILTWSKALSALALADAIEAACGIPTAPIFWAATDDSDYEEARWTQVAVPGGLETLRLPPAPRPGAPMSAMPLPDVGELIARLERGAGSLAYGELLEGVRAAYVRGATVGGAFVQLMRGALEPFGIAVLDASHSEVARAAFPILRAALDHAPRVQRALAERNAAITAGGFSPQVAEIEQLALVFSTEGSRTEKSRVRLSEASSVARRAGPEQLGATVLTRPIVERAILPTIAYCAGPGELAYFAQVSAIAEAIEAAPPLAVSRWSGTIVEPHIGRILARLGMTLDELRDPHRAETQLARAAVPQPVITALQELERVLDAGFQRLADASDSVQPPLLSTEVLDGHRRLLRHRLLRLERRIIAAAKRREGDTLRELATARGALFPDGKRQERALNLVPIASRHGPRLFALMQERAREHAETIVGVPTEEPVPMTTAAGRRRDRSGDIDVP